MYYLLVICARIFTYYAARNKINDFLKLFVIFSTKHHPQLHGKFIIIGQMTKLAAFYTASL